MSEFKGVTVLRKANVYFDGKVTSRTLIFPDDSKKTLGVLLPGEYVFGTEDKEIMEIQSGDLEFRIEGSPEWQTCTGGTAFEVPAHYRFSLRVRTITDYCCSFIK
jgi:purine/pyrimidine-nucleoside phosphorylase